MEWIDVKERLPEFDARLSWKKSDTYFCKESKPVLVVAKDGTQLIASLMEGAHTTPDAYFVTKHEGFEVEEPTHWMPLPAAPVLAAAQPVESERDQSPKKENA